MFKSTASRRIQVSSTNVPEGKSAMLPLPQYVAAERFGSPSEDTASGGGTPRSSLEKSPSSLNSDSRSTRFLEGGELHHRDRNEERQQGSPITAKSHSPNSTSSAPIKGVFSMPSSRSASRSRGGLKRAGTAEYGPPTFIYIRVRGETNYWDVVAPMLVKAMSKESLKDYLVTPQVSVRSVRSSSPSSPQDLLRPVSETVVAERIRSANKEFEVREIADFVMADIFRSLMNPWDMGAQVVDAVTAEAGGLKFQNGGVKGTPIYAVYFSELVEKPLLDQFVIELHHALGNTNSNEYEEQSEYVSTVAKKKVPVHWKFDDRAILAQKRNYSIDIDTFYRGIQLIGVSSKGSLFKEFDKV